MIFLQRSSHLPVGVDIGRDRIKLLQLEERCGSLNVVAKASAPAPADRTNVVATMARVGELVRGNGFRGRQIAMPLPREIVQVKTLRLPLMPEADLAAAVRNESEALFSIKPEKLALRVIPAGEVRQGTETRLEVLVLAVEQASIDQLLEASNQAGLTIDSLEFEPCCLYRNIERFVRRKDDENEVSVLVDVGVRQSQVVIGRGREITFNKNIEIGGRTFNDLVARKLGLSADEAADLRRRFNTLEAAEADPVRQTVLNATRAKMAELAHEVSLCLRYYSVTFRGQRPTRVRLLGGEAADNQLRQIMSAAVSVPIELFHPLAGIGNAAVLFSQPSAYGEWSVAFGSALRRVRTDVRRGDTGVRRRKGETPLVEVVDVNATMKSADTDPARREEVARA